jgi:hypothetical protein
MRTIVYCWLGLNVAFLVVQEIRYQVKRHHYRQLERDLLRAIAKLRENDHVEALIEDAWRMAAKRNAEAYKRLYRDAGLTLPDEVPTVERVRQVVFQTGLPRGSVPGIEVKAHCVGEAVEVISQSNAFRPRAA